METAEMGPNQGVLHPVSMKPKNPFARWEKMVYSPYIHHFHFWHPLKDTDQRFRAP